VAHYNSCSRIQKSTLVQRIYEKQINELVYLFTCRPNLGTSHLNRRQTGHKCHVRILGRTCSCLTNVLRLEPFSHTWAAGVVKTIRSPSLGPSSWASPFCCFESSSKTPRAAGGARHAQCKYDVH